MFVILLVWAASSLILSNLITRGMSTPLLQERSTFHYIVFRGDGEVSDGWPAISDWVSNFTTMFNNNKEILLTSCTQFNVADNSIDEIDDISSAIQLVSSSTGVDSRFILAIVMQESNGCVRAPTTNYGVINPGLMQSHDGTGTCNNGSTIQDPCPASEIMQMIKDGTAGTSSGDGLYQCLAASDASDVSMYYKAARIYNSGSIVLDGNLGQGVATHCYASDIANRLIGWSSGTSSCNDNTVGNSTSSGTINSTITGGESAQSMSALASNVVVSPILDSSPTISTQASASTTQTSVPTALSAQIYPGAASPCQTYYTVVAGDICDNVATAHNITFASLQNLNMGLDATCSNLWLGYQYCIVA